MKTNKILVVDNHPVMLKYMIDLLTKNGYQVRTAENGISAIEILKTYIPEVIFIDLVMPNISGDKLCEIIRKNPQLKDVYIIILSAIAAEEEIDFSKFGANACIAKGPFNKMAKHIFTALKQSDVGISKSTAGEVIGLGDIYKRQITKELLSAKKHFELILNNMSEGILELTLKLKIVYVNPTAVSLIGIAEEKLLASDFTELFFGNDYKRVKSMLEAKRNTLQIISERAPVILNGKEVSLSILPVKDKDAESIIVIVSDISERRRMQAQLQQDQKMKAIGILAGGIAHNFNNLLMGIQGNASLMIMDIDFFHPHFKMLKSIEKLIQSGSKLTRQLLGYARKGKYMVQTINLNQFIEEISETFQKTKKRISIHQALDRELFPIEVDQGQLEQVLLNLYLNASQAMPDRGDLFVKTCNITHKDIQSKLFKARPGKYILLTIKDTGVGMDNKTLNNIFDPFYTTKEPGSGIGLGLASCYGIIKGHKGYIDVESEIEKGTTFKIYLPASEKKIIEKKELSEEILKGSETILIVDDDEMVIDIDRKMLRKLGYKVLAAEKGKDAIDIYKENRNKIALIILNVNITDIDSEETCNSLKKVNPNVKILLSVGYNIDGQKTGILENGNNSFIQKPYNIALLSKMIRELLDK